MLKRQRRDADNRDCDADDKPPRESAAGGPRRRRSGNAPVSSAVAGRRAHARAKRNAASPLSARAGPIGQTSPFAALTRVIALPRLRHKLHSDCRLYARITTIRILVRIFVQPLTTRREKKCGEGRRRKCSALETPLPSPSGEGGGEADRMREGRRASREPSPRPLPKGVRNARLSTGYGRGRQPRLRVTMSRTSGDSDGRAAMRLSIASA